MTSPTAAALRPIRFYHRGRIVEIAQAPPTQSVLDWLREDARCCGTKEGCNEGDCGACTVVLGALDAQGQLQLCNVNACIQFMPTLDGKALFTVEDLQSLAPDAGLHPVQQALVDCHGSQCGFCTPGFAMTLWHSYEQHQPQGSRPTRAQLADALSGNLCRCTGYRPILDAGEQMFALPAAPLERAAVTAALQQLAQDSALHYCAGGAQFDAPRSLDALAALRQAKPQARLLAGNTDIGLWVNKQLRELGDVIYIGQVQELQRIEERGAELWLGAGATLEAAWQALAARAPSLREVWQRFASQPIRHSGTLGGNVANGSPIGDGPPVLMALDAQVELRCGADTRRLPLPDFYLGYMKNALQEGEFVQAIVVPLAAFARQVQAYKISKRFDCDISALCAGMALALDGERVASVRLAFGGMAATVQRAAQAEAALLGQPWTMPSVRAAQQALAQDFAPLSDLRSSSSYRLQVAQNLIERLWLQTRPGAPLPASATTVFAADADADAA